MTTENNPREDYTMLQKPTNEMTQEELVEALLFTQQCFLALRCYVDDDTPRAFEENPAWPPEWNKFAHDLTGSMFRAQDRQRKAFTTTDSSDSHKRAYEWGIIDGIAKLLRAQQKQGLDHELHDHTDCSNVPDIEDDGAELPRDLLEYDEPYSPNRS